MTDKVIVGVLILAAVAAGIFFGMDRFADTVEDFISQTAEIISSPDVASGIDAFYEFEKEFYDSERFLSLFIHDSLLEEIREDMVEIRTSLFNGERDDALLFASLLRERLLQIHRSMMPSVANIF